MPIWSRNLKGTEDVNAAPCSMDLCSCDLAVKILTSIDIMFLLQVIVSWGRMVRYF